MMERHWIARPPWAWAAPTRSAAVLAGLLLSLGVAQPSSAEDLTVQVIDIGGGLCTLSEVPGGHYMVYDAGVGLDIEQPELCADRIHQLMPAGEAIDLLILSHSDSDHVSSVARLLNLREVHRVVRTGHERDTQAWCHADYWIKVRVDDGQALKPWTRWSRLRRCDRTGKPVFVPLSPYPPRREVDFNLGHHPLRPGQEVFELGGGASRATVTLLHGRQQMPTEWNQNFATNKLTSRSRNAISIIAKLQFADRSVLFTGDSVGLDKFGESKVKAPCVATEGELVKGHQSGKFDLDSDVLIAPHHGSSNGSCLEFIELVSPGWAIFTAGHDHKHPSKTAAKRYLEAGVPAGRLLRTDRGDREKGNLEWTDDDTPAGLCHDPAGDDDVVILLKGDGSTPSVKYRQSHSPTCS